MLHLKNFTHYTPASGTEKNDIYDFMKRNDLSVIFIMMKMDLTGMRRRRFFRMIL